VSPLHSPRASDCVPLSIWRDMMMMWAVLRVTAPPMLGHALRDNWSVHVASYLLISYYAV
jgi:hypothetical protein